MDIVTPNPVADLRQRLFEDFGVALGHVIWDRDRSLTIIGIDNSNPEFPLIGRLEEGLEPVPEIVHVSRAEAHGRRIPSRIN